MPRYCCVYGCFNNSEANSDVSFHEFPSNAEKATAWKRRIRREDFQPSKYSYVCGKHFVAEDFQPPNEDSPMIFRKKRLKKNAVPSIYLRGEEDGTRKVRTTNNSNRSNKKSPSKVLSSSCAFDATLPTSLEVGNVATHDFVVENNKDEEIETLRKELEIAKKNVTALQKQLFRFENLSAEEVLKYTTLTKDSFLCLHRLIETFQPLNYWSGSTVVSIASTDQLLIFLAKSKLNLPNFVLARDYNTSRTTITNIFLTYLHALNEILFKGLMSSMPSLSKNQASQPDTFANFLNCRVIIDCTEFRITTPRQDLNAAVASYSNYKHNLTGKFLIGVAPNGTITHVSDGFPGNTSDKVITEKSGILSHLIVSFILVTFRNAMIYIICRRQGVIFCDPVEDPLSF